MVIKVTELSELLELLEVALATEPGAVFSSWDGWWKREETVVHGPYESESLALSASVP